jgi:hypothetical protein
MNIKDLFKAFCTALKSIVFFLFLHVKMVHFELFRNGFNEFRDSFEHILKVGIRKRRLSRRIRKIRIIKTCRWFHMRLTPRLFTHPGHPKARKMHHARGQPKNPELIHKSGSNIDSRKLTLTESVKAKKRKWHLRQIRQAF